MENEEPPFTSDVPPINPEGVIEDITKNGIEEVLWKHKEILYLGIRQVKAYIVEDMKVYIWSDSRWRENSVFISQKERGADSEVAWYIDRVAAVQKLVKVSNNRDFIERCVQKQITPESLKK